MNNELLKKMQNIVDRNVKHYKSDFDIDLKIMAENPDCNHWLWLVREHGSYVLQRDKVYTVDSAAHTVWLYYVDQDSEHVKAYEILNDKIKKIDYLQSVNNVIANAKKVVI